MRDFKATLLFYLTRVCAFVPGTTKCGNTGTFLGDWRTHIDRLATFQSVHANCDAARAAEFRLAWGTGPEVRIERGTRGATGIRSTGHSLAALE